MEKRKSRCNTDLVGKIIAGKVELIQAYKGSSLD